MKRISSLSLVLLLATATAALAQFPPQPAPPKCGGAEQGTRRERDACRPDVVRFCQTELKTNECDVFAILGCLQRNRTRISVACRTVLTGHGQ